MIFFHQLYMNPHAWPLLQSTAVIFTVGFLIFAQNPRSKSTLYFFLIAIAVTIWLLGNAFVYCCKEEAMGLAVYRYVSFLGVAMIVPAICIFSVEWLELSRSRRIGAKIVFFSGSAFIWRPRLHLMALLALLAIIGACIRDTGWFQNFF